MITINNFTITNNATQIAVSLKTTLGYNITSILFWNSDNFKDYSLATDLSYKLEQINHEENFTITPQEVGLSSFKDIYFIEVKDNAPIEECPECLIPALGITYNLNEYYNCLLDKIIKLQIKDCEKCNDIQSKNNVLMVGLLIDSIENSIKLGFYMEAIEHIKKLKQLCKANNCTTCKQVSCKSCGKFQQIEQALIE